MNHALSRFTTRGCVALVLFVSLGSAMAAGFDTQYEVRYGHFNGDGLVDLNVANSFSHAPFPGDGGFNSSDETYHHYDVETAICTTGQPGCDQTNLRAKLRYYSFPSYKLKPVKTNIDGERVMVRITLALFDTDDPEHYVVKGGEITQRFVESGIWQGAIQNVTTSLHIVYPGVISRTIVPQGSSYKIFTHGVGINRVLCTTTNSPLDWTYQMFLGWSNDVFGAAAFRALDKSFKRHFDSSPLSLPSSSPGSQKPSIEAPYPAGLTGSTG